LFFPLGDREDPVLDQHDVKVDVEEVHFLHLEEDLSKELSLIVFNRVFVGDQAEHLDHGENFSCRRGLTVKRRADGVKLVLTVAPQFELLVLESLRVCLLRLSILAHLCEFHGHQRSGDRVKSSFLLNPSEDGVQSELVDRRLLLGLRLPIKGGISKLHLHVGSSGIWEGCKSWLL